METIFKILIKLNDKQIYYCFQSHSRSKYYNLAVDDCYKKRHHFSSSNIKDIEESLKIVWGSVLDNTRTMSMPVPAGFPVMK